MKVLFVWLLLAFIWGTTWVFIKFGLDDLPPFIFAGSRFLAACVLLLPILFYRKTKLSEITGIGKLIFTTGFLQFFLNYGLMVWGTQFITSGLASVLQAVIPAFGLILARIYVKEPITKLKVASLLLGFVGLVIIFREQLQLKGFFAFWGSIAVVVGAFAAAYSSVLVKSKMRVVDPVILLFGQMAIGFAFLIPASFLLEGNPLNYNWSGKAIFTVFYLAVMGSIIAFWLYYWLINKIDVTKAMMISLVTPLIAIIVGAIFRGEIIDSKTLVGGIIILLSVGLIVVKPLLDRRNRNSAEI